MIETNYKHKVVGILKNRLNEPRNTIQIILGPRQVGKSWAVNDVLRDHSAANIYAIADSEIGTPNTVWITEHWHRARDKQKGQEPVVLVFDEIQKIKEWSSEVKRLWDEDTSAGRNIYVILLGSSALSLQKGLSESLMGRFEIIWFMHWSYLECQEAFGFSLEDYLYFGGYPGGARFILQEERWRHYIVNAIIEPVLTRDIPLLTEVRNPVLLRNLFLLACEYAAQELSYRKIQGQFMDVKNVLTIAGYQRMLEQTYLVSALQKWFGKALLGRNSSPKWLPLNAGLISAVKNYSKADAMKNAMYWGHLVESAVGAHLVNEGKVHNYEVYYWREDKCAVDFVLRKGDKIIGIEVKTNYEKNVKSFQAFLNRNPKARVILIGPEGIKVEEFLTTPLESYLSSL